MIQSVCLKNFGPIADLSIENFGNINLLIGPNRSGKTILLKALYCAQRTIELTGRGKNPLSVKEILSDKMYWTFQAGKLGNLVRKPDGGSLEFSMKEKDGGIFYYTFGADTTSKIVKVEPTTKSRNTNSVFIPAKEILTLLDVIKSIRDNKMEFGFDETYIDLAKALTPPTVGKIAKPFLAAREKLALALDGRVVFSKDKNAWEYVQGKYSFDINLTSEGTKKIAIFDTLIANHFLTKDSVVFIDEPESGLHPGLLINLLEIIFELAKYGVQFFIASHSYFVIKKLYNIAAKNNFSIPVVSFETDGEVKRLDLEDGMPENSIIEESVRLYREELAL